jgi:hypothetical protein
MNHNLDWTPEAEIAGNNLDWYEFALNPNQMYQRRIPEPRPPPIHMEIRGMVGEVTGLQPQFASNLFKDPQRWAPTATQGLPTGSAQSAYGQDELRVRPEDVMLTRNTTNTFSAAEHRRVAAARQQANEAKGKGSGKGKQKNAKGWGWK